MSRVRKSIGTVRLDLASEKKGYAIKSWASRAAKSPDNDRKTARFDSSSARAGMGILFMGAKLPPLEERAVIRIRGIAADPVVCPRLKIRHRIHHPPAQFSKSRTASLHTMLFQRAWRDLQEIGSLLVIEVKRGGLIRIRSHDSALRRVYG